MKTHCIHGHKYTIKNSRFVNRKDRTHIDRRCRRCEAIQQIARYRSKKLNEAPKNPKHQSAPSINQEY